MNPMLTFIVWFLVGWIASSLILTAWWAWRARRLDRSRAAAWERQWEDITDVTSPCRRIQDFDRQYADEMGVPTPHQRRREVAEMNQWWGSG